MYWHDIQADGSRENGVKIRAPGKRPLLMTPEEENDVAMISDLCSKVQRSGMESRKSTLLLAARCQDH